MGRRIFIKVCGLTTAEEAIAVAEAGADAIGLVFWPASKRAVSRAKALQICRALPPFVTRVGVFVDASGEEMARTAEEVGLDVLQLHGSEPPEALRDLPRRVMKALRVGQGFDPEVATRYSSAGADLLLDTEDAAAPGGTGQPFDWSRAVGLSARVRFLILAGGLHPGNVAAAIRAVAPSGVDVSSGVEREPGRKDIEKVRQLVKAVREAEIRRS